MPRRPEQFPVPKKRQPPKSGEPPPARRQYSLAFAGAIAARIDATAAALSLDAPQLLRMMVAEHLAEYEERAAKVRGKAPLAAES